MQLIFALLLLLLPCQAQDSIHDDDQTWNSFFRDLQTMPQFPYPGTLNNIEWDEYTLGFLPSLWDTKAFLSILVLPPSYIGGSAGTKTVLWENFWGLFEIFLESEVRRTQLGGSFYWERVKIQKIWDVYIQMLKELYCCPYFLTINGTYTFGCEDATKENGCCVRGKPLSTCTDIGQKIVKEWSSHSLQAMKFKFYLWLCLIYINRPYVNLGSKTEPVLELQKVCPNPCRSKPCDDLPNALPGSCLQAPRPLGFYRGEFTCVCRTNYFFDIYTKQCQQMPPCSLNPCYPNGTEYCIDMTIAFECRCRPEYTGSICSGLVNPCQRRRRSTDISGNIACRTSLGNRCVPQHGRDIFACECVPPYRRETDYHRLAAAFHRTGNDSVLPPDNCMAKLDACERVSCGGERGSGLCMPSGDLLAFVCVCEKNEDGYPLFEGEFCETPVSQWLGWSRWGVCRPECGESCFQARERLCSHLEGHAYCKGSDEELRTCEPACRPCPNRSFSHLSGVFVKETAAPLLLAVLSLFLMQLLVLAVLEWLLSPDVTPPI